VTTRINLLPWREIRRREKDRQLLSASIGTWILAAMVVFYAQWYMNDVIDHQNKRNSFLSSEISKLDKKIAEIEDLKRRKDALLARMEIIQKLQSDRTKIVHVVDDLVRKLPKGVYLTQFTKKKNAMALEGMAQSNARVSSLMNSLDASDWFTNANLDVINVTPQGGSRISKFSLKVREESKRQKQGGAAAGGQG
jgi:type IV pilus assembly protein PilN